MRVACTLGCADYSDTPEALVDLQNTNNSFLHKPSKPNTDIDDSDNIRQNHTKTKRRIHRSLRKTELHWLDLQKDIVHAHVLQPFSTLFRHRAIKDIVSPEIRAYRSANINANSLIDERFNCCVPYFSVIIPGIHGNSDLREGVIVF